MVSNPENIEMIHNNYRSGFSSILVLSDRNEIVYAGLQFVHFSPFYEILNLKIGQLVDDGLINHWSYIDKNPRGLKRF